MDTVRVVLWCRHNSCVYALHGVYVLCRCSVFLVDKETEELVAKVFDGDIQEKQVAIALA